MSTEEAEKILEEAAAKLGEHFDVQIMASWNDEGLTKCIQRGAGNWYARQGMAHEFINADIAQEAAQQIAARMSPDTDEDDWKQGESQ